MIRVQVKCFADLATDKVRDSYESLEQYQHIWIPILAMEAASKTASACGDTILCDHVPVWMKKRNDSFNGYLRIPLAFCKVMSLMYFNLHFIRLYVNFIKIVYFQEV